MKILVTGGAGFIGSAVIREAVRAGFEAVNLDKLTYSSSLDSLADVRDDASYWFEKIDICERNRVSEALERHQPDCIMHLAAESHVDRSIDVPGQFIETNILGTYHLLEASSRYFQGLSGERKRRFRFHHVSTDEVFGSLDLNDAPFSPNSPYAPRSPYSASKAASDHLVMAWHHTYGLPVVMSNASNNFGPYQFPEKLIPLMTIKALNGEPMPVYGSGENIRDWLFVGDHARALLDIVRNGTVGDCYLVGAESEHSNIEVVEMICDILDELTDGKSHRNLISLVDDRPGHDLRYAIDSSKLRDNLGWTPQMSFGDGLRRTVGWYIDNEHWWRPLMSLRYDGSRLGLAPDTFEAKKT